MLVSFSLVKAKVVLFFLPLNPRLRWLELKPEQNALKALTLKLPPVLANPALFRCLLARLDAHGLVPRVCSSRSELRWSHNCTSTTMFQSSGWLSWFGPPLLRPWFPPMKHKKTLLSATRKLVERKTASAHGRSGALEEDINKVGVCWRSGENGLALTGALVPWYRRYQFSCCCVDRCTLILCNRSNQIRAEGIFFGRARP